MEGFPTLKQWVGFLFAIYIASLVINTVTKRVPVLDQIQQGF